jgi:DNA-binding YbaB/EbfC family protein
MMKQLQKMQQGVAKAQEDLAQEKIEATAGGGMVSVVVNGQQEVLEVKIKKEAVDPEDVEMLEDMLLAATNEALRKSRDIATAKLGQLTGGLDIPGLF